MHTIISKSYQSVSTAGTVTSYYMQCFWFEALSSVHICIIDEAASSTCFAQSFIYDTTSKFTSYCSLHYVLKRSYFENSSLGSNNDWFWWKQRGLASILSLSFWLWLIVTFRFVALILDIKAFVSLFSDPTTRNERPEYLTQTRTATWLWRSKCSSLKCATSLIFN